MSVAQAFSTSFCFHLSPRSPCLPPHHTEAPGARPSRHPISSCHRHALDTHLAIPSPPPGLSPSTTPAPRSQPHPGPPLPRASWGALSAGQGAQPRASPFRCFASRLMSLPLQVSPEAEPAQEAQAGRPQVSWRGGSWNGPPGGGWWRHEGGGHTRG